MSQLRPTLVLLAVGAVAAAHAQPAELTWDPTPQGGAPDGVVTPGDGRWDDDRLTNWTEDDGASNTQFEEGDSVTFGGTPARVVILERVAPERITFAVDGDTVAGGQISSVDAATPTAVQMDGDARISSELRGRFSVAGPGTLTVAGDKARLNRVDLAAGATLINRGATLSGRIIVEEGATFTTTGTIGSLVSRGDVAARGTVTGSAIFNRGSLNLTGDLAVQGALTTRVDLNVDTALTAESVLNTGDLTVQAGQTLTVTAGDVVNNGVGSVRIAGTVAGSVEHNGSALTVSGRVTGDVTANSSMVLAGGRIDGTLVVNNGVATVSGTGAQVGALTANSTVLLNSAGGLTVDGDAVANGRVRVAPGVDTALRVGGRFTQAGIINVTSGSLTVTATTISIAETGTVAGAVALQGRVENAGTLRLDLGQTLAGDVVTLETGNTTVAADIDAGGANLINRGGTLRIAPIGSISNADVVANNNGGVLTIESGATVATRLLRNDAASRLVVRGTVDGDVAIDRGSVAVLDGAVTGNVTSSGTTDLAADIGGALRITRGTVTVDGGSTVAGTVTVNGPDTAVLTVEAGVRLEAGALSLIDGDATVAGVAAVTDSVVIRADGTLTVEAGGRVAAAAINLEGRAVIAGQVSAPLTIQGGTAEVSGTHTGGIRLAGGTLTSTGSLSNGLRVLDGQATVGGVLSGRSIVQGGTLTITGAATTDARVSAGTLRLEGTLVGGLDQTGGTVEIAAPATLTGATTVGAQGRFTLDGTLDGTLQTAGIADLNGTVTGDVETSGQTALAAAHTGGRSIVNNDLF